MITNNRDQDLEKLFQIQRTLVDELVEVLGQDHVLWDDHSKKVYSRSSLPNGTTPKVVVFPETSKEIASILKICNFWEQKVHVISTGKNWGYSDACAPSNETVIIHLKRMNKILDFNGTFGYLVLEPGVTQKQVEEFLKAEDAKWFSDVTGAGPDTSLIGNISERGFGHGPLGDRFSQSLNYEIVLPNGAIMNSGFGEFTNAHCANLNKWGVGASLDGLFSQSNLGIITKMTIWLAPKPEVFKGIFFSLKEDSDILETIDLLRPLKMDGTIQTNVHIGNDLRIFAMNHCSPNNNKDFLKALTMMERKELQELNGVGAWNGSIGVCGSRAQVSVNLKRITRVLKKTPGIKKVIVLDNKKINFLESVCKKLSSFTYFQKCSKLLLKAKQGLELLQGTPPENSIQGCLWRTKLESSKKLSNDPLDYKAGFIWISPIIPMEGFHLKRVSESAKNVFAKYDFDFLNTLTMINQRSLSSVMTICYDRNNEVEKAKALKCHDEVLDLLLQHGYPPYRGGNLSFERLSKKQTGQQQLLKRIKTLIDPRNILSPGKYIQSK